MTADAPIISIRDLHKTYRDGLLRRRRIQALQGVSFDVAPGEIFGLLGPNGAGKTTLIKVLLGIVRKTGGAATLLGRPAGTRCVRGQIGYLPESHQIPRHLTGDSALEYYGCLSGLTVGEVRRRRPELLEQVGLEKWGGTSVKKYSKGMKQRLGLAQAMIHRPEMIILDEPTDGVDPIGRAAIREVLRRLREGGTTVFLNSHLLQEIELICDRVAILGEGRLVRVGRVEELTASNTESVVTIDVHETDQARIKQAVQGLPVTQWAQRPDGTSFQVQADDSAHVNDVIDRLRNQQILIRSVTRSQSTLEEAFLKLVATNESQA